MSKRLDPEIRREQVLSAAIKLAETCGYTHVKRSDVATAAKVSEALISHIFGSVLEMHREIMRHAVKTKNHRIIVQGLAVHDKQALRAPRSLRQAALKTISLIR